jgi:HD-GYP domain-containing protein (c-di-GMP phosphodiesterase class II)
MTVLLQNTDMNEQIFHANNIFYEALQLFEKNSYKECLEKINIAHRIYLLVNYSEKISICLSFMGLLKYLIDKDTYKSSLLLLEDARFLAQNDTDENALGINKFAFSQISIAEKNYEDALLYLKRATYMVTKYPYIKMRVLESLAFLNFKLKKYESAYEYVEQAKKEAKSGNYEKSYNRILNINKDLNEINDTIYNDSLKDLDRPQNATIPSDPLIALLKIARTISAEIDLNRLLTTIAEQTKIALNADRCTVFLLDKDKNELWSKVALGMEHKEIRFPINKGLAGHVATTGQTINIQNAYDDERFNHDIDVKTGYKTKSILCMPIRNLRYEVIGVFQVINKLEGFFDKSDENLLVTIGASAGIALENNRLFENQQKMLREQKKLFNGFIDTLAASIDARDKITAGHSMRVTQYSTLLCNRAGVDKIQTEKIYQAAMLHDIGKIGIADSILQKKGKLTDEEYRQIQDHVKFTHDILSKIADKSESFKDVVEIASSHHEKYNGKGYFRHKGGKDIPFGGRILAVADVFDAITSIRHYRDRMPIQDAIKIIREGADNHFDKDIVNLFLTTTCDKILNIILFDSENVLDSHSQKILEQYNLYELESIVNKLEKTEQEQELTDIFNEYYINRSSKGINCERNS